MADKRNITITAKSKEGFEAVEKMLDMFDVSFINKFNNARENSFSATSLELTGTSSNSIIEIPSESTDFSVKFEEIPSTVSKDSKMFKAKGHFRIMNGKTEHFISFTIEGYFPFNEVTNVKALK